MERGFSDFIKKLRSDMPKGRAINHQHINIGAAFSEIPQPLDYVLPGLIAGSVGSLISPGGVGKSMFALQLSILIAGGSDRLGVGALPIGRVVYLPAEDPFPILHQRLYTLGKYLTYEERQLVDENLTIIPLNGDMPDLMSKKWFEVVESLAKYSRLLILDTLRRFHQAEENSGTDMAELIGVMEKIASVTGCSILFLHHANKSSAHYAGIDQQHATRGSSVLTDNVRWQAYLVGMTQEEAKKNGIPDFDRRQYVRFGVSKCNYHSGGTDRWLIRGDGGILTAVELQENAHRGRRRAEV
ncbi:hypothetical protein GCM10011502_26840 [Oceanisphaera marina]|uniref:Replication protein A n=2 Tax=Oceanisphaera marina TaxID=2017550 RepID=A0ABQ1IXV1_9GAMM|nr:hypothetical protein GCM10011502_26840 [Oceanisphaera marina]